MDLKINDVAELLNVSENTIRRWLSEGKLPAYHINQQPHFSRTEIEEWLIHQRQEKGLGGLEDQKNEKQLPPNSTLGTKQFSLYRAIHKGAVLANVPGNTKSEVIRATMKSLASDLNVDAEGLSDLLLEREKLQATALNNGIGIPHTRDFLLSDHHDVVAVIYPAKPLDYGALDHLPVHTLFFLFACDDKRHLNLLAKIAHLSSQPKTLEFLKTKPSKEVLLSYIKDWESTLSQVKI
jgi:PTS system nitrogen regulatory IIA component